MGTTPKWAIPYAEPGEWLADYPSAVDKPAAQRIEAVLPIIAVGTVNWAAGVNDMTINFPAGRFPAAPTSVVLTATTGFITTGVDTITATSFRARATYRNSAGAEAALPAASGRYVAIYLPVAPA